MSSNYTYRFLPNKLIQCNIYRKHMIIIHFTAAPWIKWGVLNLVFKKLVVMFISLRKTELIISRAWDIIELNECLHKTRISALDVYYNFYFFDEYYKVNAINYFNVYSNTPVSIVLFKLLRNYSIITYINCCTFVTQYEVQPNTYI